MCKRNIDRLPLQCPQLGTWLVTLAGAWTGSLTSDPSACQSGTTPARAAVLFQTYPVPPKFTQEKLENSRRGTALFHSNF